MTKKSGQQNNTSNPTPPIATPDFGGTSNWSLQALVELKTDLGKLSVSIDHLCDKVDRAEASTRNLESRIDKVEKRILVAATIVGLVVAAGGFVANKAIDFGLDMAKKSFEMQISNQSSSNNQTEPKKPN